MHHYYLSTECEHCGEDILYGPCITTIEITNLRGTTPVIPISSTEQTKFHCPKCGTDNYTGDIDWFIDNEPPPTEEELEDDETNQIN